MTNEKIRNINKTIKVYLNMFTLNKITNKTNLVMSH